MNNPAARVPRSAITSIQIQIQWQLLLLLLLFLIRALIFVSYKTELAEILRARQSSKHDVYVHDLILNAHKYN